MYLAAQSRFNEEATFRNGEMRSPAGREQAAAAGAGAGGEWRAGGALRREDTACSSSCPGGESSHEGSSTHRGTGPWQGLRWPPALPLFGVVLDPSALCLPTVSAVTTHMPLMKEEAVCSPFIKPGFSA